MYAEKSIWNSVISSLVAVVVLALLPTGASAEEAAKADGTWQFAASIYGWFPDISGQTTGGGGFQVDIDQILENLEFTMMGTFEARRGNWGVLTDVIYMDVQGTQAGPVASDKLDLTSWIWNLAGSYRVLDKPAFVMDALAGARYLDVDQTLTRTPSGGGSPSSLNAELANWDAIVGVSGRVALGKKKALFIPYELDVGTGDSDLTAQAVAGVGYSFGWWELAAVWRYLYYDLSSDIGINDMSFNGPAAGVVFRW